MRIALELVCGTRSLQFPALHIEMKCFAASSMVQEVRFPNSARARGARAYFALSFRHHKGCPLPELDTETTPACLRRLASAAWIKRGAGPVPSRFTALAAGVCSVRLPHIACCTSCGQVTGSRRYRVRLWVLLERTCQGKNAACVPT